MNLTKREFIQVMGAGTMAGMSMGKFSEASAATAAHGLYDIPKFGNVSFLHMTDCHAQLKPIYFRKPQNKYSPTRFSSQKTATPAKEKAPVKEAFYIKVFTFDL